MKVISLFLLQYKCVFCSTLFIPFFGEIALCYTCVPHHQVHTVYKVLSHVLGGKDGELCPVVSLHDQCHRPTLVVDGCR